MDDEFVERATTFDGSEAPSGKRLDESESFHNYYRRLSLANSLDWNGKWRDERRHTKKDSTAVVDAIAGQLDLTDYQKEQARRAFNELPPQLNKSSLGTGFLAFIVCGLVGREDGRDYHPNCIHQSTKGSTRFAEVAEELGVDYPELNRWWFRIKRVMF